MDNPVKQDSPELDRRLTELQSQVNRLSLSLHLWQERQDRLLEQRLVDWSAIEERAQKDAAARMRELQTTIEHEWGEFRQVNEEPARQVRELESSLGQKLTDLTEQVQSAIAELRGVSIQRSQPSPPPAASWPLDDVVRLHNQFRDGGESNGDGEHALPKQALMLPATAASLAERVDILERAVHDAQAEKPEATEISQTVSGGWRLAILLLAIGVVVAGVLVARLQRQVTAATTRVSLAEQQAQLATKTAAAQIAAARDEAAQQIAEARDAAVKAQVIGDVLAAPDLTRYNLVGGDEAGSFGAQVLWSRSRGLVFSGSRLPAPPPESTYQIWLLSNGEPVSVGTFVPDGGGRFSMATSTVPRVQPPVLGLSVTVENKGGSQRPTGRTVLARPQAAPAPLSAPPSPQP